MRSAANIEPTTIDGFCAQICRSHLDTLYTYSNQSESSWKSSYDPYLQGMGEILPNEIEKVAMGTKR